MPTSPQHEPEWLTRKRRIDPRLEAAGWRVVSFNPQKPLSQYSCCAIEEFPTVNGPADYALCVSGQILGVVEAKRVGLGPVSVLTQAERYSHGVENSPYNFDGFRIPFLYATNGEAIWHHDIRNPMNRSRQIARFHTPKALSEILGSNFEAAAHKLLLTPNDHPRLRPYQIEANNAIEHAIAERKRQMLVAMATGTGKTFTMVNQVYRLMKSGTAKRVLFMVDRRVLAAQAVRAFCSFEPEPGLKFDKIYQLYSQRFHREDFDEDEKFDPSVLPSNYLLDPKPSHTFVYVSTIQRMTINLFGRNEIFALGDEEIDADADQLDIPIHAFDLIVADECHRGYTTAELSIWRKTLDHFDAIKIGLTATPAAHTKAYFKDVVYRYEYGRAVREGYLVDYDAVKIKSDVRMNGIFLQEGEQVSMIDPDTGNETLDQLEDERKFESDEVEHKVTSPDSNRKILEEIKKYAAEHERDFERFPKILIFAANDLPHTSHADQLVEIARDVFGQGDSFVQKITGRVDRPLQWIREFRNRKLPKIVVTVDLLSTGVDIPDLEYIVFLRTVKSRILFEQMLGRGTRIGENCDPPKSHFVVFDCFDGTLLEYFRNATAITAEPPEVESKTIIEVIEDIWDNRDREYNIRRLVKRLQRIDKRMSANAREMFSSYIPDGNLAKYARELPGNLNKDFVGAMALLRDSNFQYLLMNYEPAKRTFIIASTEDTVESSWLIRGANGIEYKPEDYLTAFSRFVQDNPAHVEAIEILLKKPKGWKPQALNDLREKLKATPQNFTDEKLQKAHQARYDKALADIISMVKHAARDDEKLYTAEERVNMAFGRITAGLTFTEEQRQWLERIRAHMVENLSIDQADFDSILIFTRAGGWSRANKVFEGKLPKLIEKFNEAIAA
jgi:type I restriction enzyme, R subunit